MKTKSGLYSGTNKHKMNFFLFHFVRIIPAVCRKISKKKKKKDIQLLEIPPKKYLYSLVSPGVISSMSGPR